MATLAIKLHKPKRAEDRAKRIDAAKLKVPEIKAAFQLELRNCFPALEEKREEYELSSFHRTLRETGDPGIQKREKRRMDTARNMGQNSDRKQMKEKIDQFKIPEGETPLQKEISRTG